MVRLYMSWNRDSVYIYTNTLFRHLWTSRGSLFVRFRCFHRILVIFRHFGWIFGIFMIFWWCLAFSTISMDPGHRGAAPASPGWFSIVFIKGFQVFWASPAQSRISDFQDFAGFLWFWVILMDLMDFCDFHGSIVYVVKSRFRIYIYQHAFPTSLNQPGVTFCEV